MFTETERRLRRDLKRTRALLADAQMMLDRAKDGQASRASIKQLRNQVIRGINYGLFPMLLMYHSSENWR